MCTNCVVVGDVIRGFWSLLYFDILLVWCIVVDKKEEAEFCERGGVFMH